jgi:hypothetical protein
VGVTIAASVILFIDVFFTVSAAWFYHLRAVGNPVNTPVEHFYAQTFPDQFMAERFGNAQLKV